MERGLLQHFLLTSGLISLVLDFLKVISSINTGIKSELLEACYFKLIVLIVSLFWIAAYHSQMCSELTVHSLWWHQNSLVYLPICC